MSLPAIRLEGLAAVLRARSASVEGTTVSVAVEEQGPHAVLGPTVAVSLMVVPLDAPELTV